MTLIGWNIKGSEEIRRRIGWKKKNIIWNKEKELKDKGQGWHETSTGIEWRKVWKTRVWMNQGQGSDETMKVIAYKEDRDPRWTQKRDFLRIKYRYIRTETGRLRNRVKQGKEQRNDVYNNLNYLVVTGNLSCRY